jgi:hypothetical protein
VDETLEQKLIIHLGGVCADYHAWLQDYWIRSLLPGHRKLAWL